jgi:hypothetical protein
MYTDKSWAEDLRGRDLSADPGPRPEGRHEAAPGSGLGFNAINPFTVLLVFRLP